MSNKNLIYLANSTFYVYALIDPRNGQPFYVGKGKGNRVFQHYRNKKWVDKTNPPKANKIKKLQKLGYEPVYQILFETLNEQEAYSKEVEFILKWGRKGIDPNGILTNVTVRATTGTSKQSKSVDQYSLSGEYLCTFPNSFVAAQHYNGKCKGSRITSCCKRKPKNKMAYGFYWTYHNKPLDLNWCSNKQKKPVYQWTLEGNFVCKHESITSASRQLKCSSATATEAVRKKTSVKEAQLTLSDSSPGKYVKKTCPITYKTVYQWSLDRNLIAQYPSLYHASKETNIVRTNIYHAIVTTGYSNGFLWSHDSVLPETSKCKKKKKVMCLNTEQIFDSVKEASNFFNILESAISRACHKKGRKTKSGLEFTFV